jgi:hypothetical protein
MTVRFFPLLFHIRSTPPNYTFSANQQTQTSFVGVADYAANETLRAARAHRAELVN